MTHSDEQPHRQRGQWL